MIRKKMLFLIIFAPLLFVLFSCNEYHEYHEVYVIVVDNQPFYFVNPSDGKDTLIKKYLHDEEPEFIYLYEPTEGIEFSYEHFFSTIQTQSIKKDSRSNKYYVLSTDDIDTWINQYYIDKTAWESNQP